MGVADDGMRGVGEGEAASSKRKTAKSKGGVAAESATKDRRWTSVEKATAASSTPATTRGDPEWDRCKTGAAKDTSGSADPSERKSAPIGSRQEAEQPYDVWIGSAQDVQHSQWQFLSVLWALIQKFASIAWLLSWFTK